MEGNSFSAVFQREPEVTASAPGRVNLLGEHTDYSEGYVLPTTIGRRARIQLAPSPDPQCHVFSSDLSERVSFTLEATPPEGFARYVYGCLKVLERRGIHIPPVLLHIASDVPIGMGLSSSAALEVAVLRGIRAWLQLTLDDVSLAQLAQQAEIEFAQVKCGIMDQMASSLADARHMLFLDTRTLDRQLLPLPPATEILIVDSGPSRFLAGSAYNTRYDECQEAARQLGLTTLRDTTDETLAWTLPEPLNRRAYHVISENNRVLEVLKGIDAPKLGTLMRASHESLRSNYDVSTPELDLLVSLLGEHPACYGAKLTGAGFGGACVALVDEGSAADVAAQALPRYEQSGQAGEVILH